MSISAFPQYFRLRIHIRHVSLALTNLPFNAVRKKSLMFRWKQFQRILHIGHNYITSSRTCPPSSFYHSIQNQSFTTSTSTTCMQHTNNDMTPQSVHPPTNSLKDQAKDRYGEVRPVHISCMICGERRCQLHDINAWVLVSRTCPSINPLGLL